MVIPAMAAMPMMTGSRLRSMAAGKRSRSSALSGLEKEAGSPWSAAQLVIVPQARCFIDGWVLGATWGNESLKQAVMMFASVKSTASTEWQAAKG